MYVCMFCYSVSHINMAFDYIKGCSVWVGIYLSNISDYI